MDIQDFSKPIFLAPLDELPASDDFSVLTDRRTIRYYAKKICDALHHPVTIIDINRMGKEFNEQFRIDSEIEYFSLRNSCRLFRHCAGETKCHRCDEYHANLFRNYLIQQPHDEIIPSFFYDGYAQEPPTVLNQFSRKVLEYHCPMLGYRELLFPLYFDDSLIGVLFLGQSIVVRAGDKDLLPRIQNMFFSREENNVNTIFSDFIRNNSLNENCNAQSFTAEEIKDLIINADAITEKMEELFRCAPVGNEHKKNQMTMIFETTEDYNIFIQAACEELDLIENDLKKEYTDKRKKYFHDISKEIVAEFFKQTPSVNNDADIYKRTQNALARKWNAFYKAVKILQDAFGFDNISIIGDGEALSIMENKDKYIYPKPENDPERKKWYCNFTDLETEELFNQDYVCSLDKPELLKRFHSKNKKNVFLILYFDMGLIIEVSDLEKNKQLYLDMANAIGHSFVKIRLSIALSAANYMSERHVLTLRMNRHESAHISTKLNDNMMRYFQSSGTDFFDLESEKRQLVVDDMVNTIRLISNMAENIGIITGSVNSSTIRGKEKKLDVFDLMYKWQIMFREKLTDRNLDLKILREYDTLPCCFSERYKDAPRFLFTNPDLFELLIYNLVDNAVKYAYIGSTIYLRWIQLRDRSCFTVTNFGPEIKKDDRIYELYVRGNMNKRNYVDGDGIGLFVVKKIENLLGLQCRHKCEYISEFHLPLISWYIEEPFLDLQHRIKQKDLVEYQNSFDVNLLNSILNDNPNTRIRRRDLSREYLDVRIDNDTWKTTFEVFVPESPYH